VNDALPLPQESLRPPSRDNPRLGVLMSALAHAGLITALTLGVQWRNEEPAGVEAELWAATPQIAAPRAEPPPEPVKQLVATPAPPPPPAAVKPPPPPPPDTSQRDADIALEKAKAQQAKLDKARQEEADQRARDKRQREEKAAKEAKLRQERLDKEQQEKERQDKLKAAQAEQRKQEQLQQQKAEKAAQAEAQRLKDQREAQLRRMTEQLGGTGAANSTGTAARDAGPSAGYAGRIKARIKPNVVLTDEVSGNPVAEVEVRVAPDGTIIGRRIVKSSGNKAWDDTVLRAIDRTGVLPRDTNGRVEPTMIISFRPYE
jgi:colicin import membrane protein